MEIPHKLREYIDANRAGSVPLTNPDEPLGIDSLGLIRLVGFMESDLGIRIEDDELLAENFQNLRTLGALLERKSPASEASKVSDEVI
jgi:acyl carrier protein